MSGVKRIRSEYLEVQESLNIHRIWKQLRNFTVNEINLLNWEALILPDDPPYNKGAFKVEINFPSKNFEINKINRKILLIGNLFS
jgi:ubiquitin-conjugating enzyme E2 L3